MNATKRSSDEKSWVCHSSFCLHAQGGKQGWAFCVFFWKLFFGFTSKNIDIFNGWLKPKDSFKIQIKSIYSVRIRGGQKLNGRLNAVQKSQTLSRPFNIPFNPFNRLFAVQLFAHLLSWLHSTFTTNTTLAFVKSGLTARKRQTT